MRALILADRHFAEREHAMLSRLEVGLADAGVRVAHATPALAVGSGALAAAVEYSETGPPFSRGPRAAALIDRLTGPKEPPIDVVHVFGGRAWSFAAEVARRLGATLVVDVWRAGLVRLARAFAAAHEAQSPVFVAPDREIVRALARELRGADVRHTPWGVIAPPEPRPILQPELAPSVLLAGSGFQPESARAALAGLAEARRLRPSLLVVADARVASRAALWSLAGTMGLRDALSLLDNADAHRDITLQTDLLVWPEALGEHHTLLLDAMASGVVVIAAADPMNSTLADGRTCRLLTRPTPDDWAGAIMAMLDDPDGARALALSARAAAKDAHRASSHVSAVLGLYESHSTPEPIRLSAQ